MLMSLILIVVGGVLLYLGAESLVRGSAAIALKFGISPLVIGLTVVAYGTSTPELIVSIQAALSNHGDIAVGNVIGSNIFNIAMILGLCALIRPLAAPQQLIKIDAPIMLLVGFAGLFIIYNHLISRLEGLILVAGLIAYTGFNFWYARRHASESQKDNQIPAKINNGGLLKYYGFDTFLIILGLGLLVLGSNFFVEGSVQLARLLGISEAVIGLTIVAAGTSLPELATSVVAAAKKQADIAIGNIVGSNIYNILAILGISASLKPIHAPNISAVDLYTMLGLSLMLCCIIFISKGIKRWQGGLFVLLYLIYLYYLWPV